MAQTKYSIEQYLLQLQFTIEQFGTVYSTVQYPGSMTKSELFLPPKSYNFELILEIGGHFKIFVSALGTQSQ